MKNFTIGNAWRFKKYYLFITQPIGGAVVTKYYKVPYTGLQFTEDPDTGEIVPTNPIQEYKQILDTALTKQVREFRKEFRKYAKAYWDMLPETDTRGGYPESFLPKNMRDFELDKFEFLKLIKQNAYTKKHTWRAGKSQVDINTLSIEVAVQRWLDRFSKAIYSIYKAKHKLEKVPLGTPCPEHRHK